LIGTPFVIDVQCRGHWFNTIGIELRQLGNETKDAFDLWPKRTYLIVGKLQPS
jgi:hypothetical protein